MGTDKNIKLHIVTDIKEYSNLNTYCVILVVVGYCFVGYFLTMTTLSSLVEAAKLVECDEYSHKNRRRYSHKMLEKNRRADMRNYFQLLKASLPRLKDVSKATNLSILTAAIHHIQELTELDRNYQKEKRMLRKRRLDLAEHFEQLQKEVEHQISWAQLLAEEEKCMEETVPKMMSVEVQANEKDIKAELPPEGREQIAEKSQKPLLSESSPKMMSVEVQANEKDIKAELPPDIRDRLVERGRRPCLSSLKNALSQNVSIKSTTINSKSSQAKSIQPVVCEKSLGTLGCLSSDSVTLCNENIVAIQCDITIDNSRSTTRRKRKNLLR